MLIMIKCQFFLKYLILFSIIFLFEVINSQFSLRPQERIFHTATYINDKLYILGGESISTNSTVNDFTQKEFFYLDCSKSFNTTTNLPWQNLSNIEIPLHWSAASARGGINNDTLFLYGGFLSPTNNSNHLSLFYTYETQNDLWTIPIIKGDDNNNITRKRSLEAVSDYNGKIYLFGGSSDIEVSNDMIILDTINSVLKVGSLIKAPTPRFSYGATLLSNQNIIYFGGNDGKEVLGLDVVYLYDTVNDVWNTNEITGFIPSKRYLFSTVLGLDGKRVIIFGGFEVSYTDSLYVFDITTFKWYSPVVIGQLPSNRYNHKANVIGDFMIVSFGYGYQQGKESDILLLNITNNEEYIWSTVYTPLNLKDTIIPSLTPSSPISNSSSSPTITQTNTPVSTQQQSDQLSSSAKPILIAAVTVSILLLLGGLFL